MVSNGVKITWNGVYHIFDRLQDTEQDQIRKKRILCDWMGNGVPKAMI